MYVVYGMFVSTCAHTPPHSPPHYLHVCYFNFPCILYSSVLICALTPPILSLFLLPPPLHWNTWSYPCRQLSALIVHLLNIFISLINPFSPWLYCCYLFHTLTQHISLHSPLTPHPSLTCVIHLSPSHTLTPHPLSHVFVTSLSSVLSLALPHPFSSFPP